MLIYRAAFASQTTVDLGDGLGNTPIVDEDEAIAEAMRLVRKWTKLARCTEPVLVLSAVKSDSFRHRLWPAYKANRTAEKPAAYNAVRAALSDELEVLAEPGLEADDLLGIYGTEPGAEVVVVSGDKDMKTLPTLVLNPMHEDKPTRIRPTVADQMWMKQTMVGDAVDGYPGIPKVGPVTAQNLILNPTRLRKTVQYVGKRNPKPVEKWVEGEPCSVWQAMVDRAARAGLTEAELVAQAQLARILRHGDWNQDTRTVRLWTPNGPKELPL
ncbi:DNA polymerase-1 [Devosia enhydra]|uniref:DNA polymerase-1 n=2 Tax=Devosia enhydra TaxID=665118 RepID=A0A1K2HTW0_9HYPH|nr:DNA polymerase-1 [Devosia enhydra]